MWEHQILAYSCGRDAISGRFDSMLETKRLMFPHNDRGIQMKAKKLLAIFASLLLCLSVLTLSGCANSRSLKSLDKTFTVIGVVTGIASVVEWVVSEDE